MRLGADLEAPWLEKVYMAVASEEGFAAAVTASDLEETRAETSRGAMPSWTAQAEATRAEVEQGAAAEGDEEDEMISPEMGGPGFLGLFAGSERPQDAARAGGLSWGELVA
eukprot:8753511-Pyramimonas_sp.AAC.1